MVFLKLKALNNIGRLMADKTCTAYELQTAHMKNEEGT